MVKYNKLVRDHIPNIIKSQNRTPIFSILDDESYIKALDKKLLEEVNEYLSSNDKEELADILEVLDAIMVYRNINDQEMTKLKESKNKNNGKFNKRYFLQEVLDNG